MDTERHMAFWQEEDKTSKVRFRDMKDSWNLTGTALAQAMGKNGGCWTEYGSLLALLMR